MFNHPDFLNDLAIIDGSIYDDMRRAIVTYRSICALRDFKMEQVENREFRGGSWRETYAIHTLEVSCVAELRIYYHNIGDGWIVDSLVVG